MGAVASLLHYLSMSHRGQYIQYIIPARPRKVGNQSTMCSRPIYVIMCINGNNQTKIYFFFPNKSNKNKKQKINKSMTNLSFLYQGVTDIYYTVCNLNNVS